jgi:hypothetical protein
LALVLFTRISHNNLNHNKTTSVDSESPLYLGLPSSLQPSSTISIITPINNFIDQHQHQRNTAHASCLLANNLWPGRNLNHNKTGRKSTATVPFHPLPRPTRAVAACTTSSHHQKSLGAQDATERLALTSQRANPTWFSTDSTSITAPDALAWSDTTAAERHPR